MNGCGTSSVTAIVAAFSLCMLSVGHAQTQQQATAKLLTEDKLTPIEAPAIPLSIVEGDQLVDGQMVFADGKTRISVPNRPVIELPRILETLVSLDGQTIVQYGDELDQSHPRRTNLYWTDNTGKTLAQLVDYYAENALVSISDDGFTAVSGPLFKDRTTTVLSLYTPTGEKLWERTLERDQRSAHLRVTMAGNHIALVTTDSARWLQNHLLHIVDKDGTSVSTGNDFRIIQKIVVVDAGAHLFVQGYDDYGLVAISSGSVSWKKAGKIRMASLHGAKMDATGRQLFLTLADFRGKPQANYRWRLVELNPTDGEERTSVWLPGEYPGTARRVFERIALDQVQVRTPTARLTFSWQAPQEDGR